MTRHLAATLLTAVAAALLGAAPAGAQLSCPDETVKLSAAPTAAVAGQAVSYAYAFCRAEPGGSYTTEVRDLGAAPDAPALRTHTVPLDAVPGVESGADAFTPEQPGRYLISVAYTPAGWSTYRSRGEQLITVTAPPAADQPPGAEQAPAATAPAAEDPSAAPQEEAPASAGTDPSAAPQEPATAGAVEATAPSRAPVAPRPKLELSARAVPVHLTAGATTRLLVTLTGASVTPAASITVCLRPAAGLTYVSASRPAALTGGRRCARTGQLRAGRRVRVRFTVRAGATARAGLSASVVTASSPGAASRTINLRVRVVRTKAGRTSR